MQQQTRYPKSAKPGSWKGGGVDVSNSSNPIAHALKYEPLQFAAGVDVLSVFKVILKVSSHDDLLDACKKIHAAIGSGDPTAICNVCASLVIPAIAKAEKAWNTRADCSNDLLKACEAWQKFIDKLPKDFKLQVHLTIFLQKQKD